MTNRWALINSDTLVVENVVIWGGEDDMFSGFIKVELNAGEPCAPGFTYDPAPLADPRFIAPIPPDPLE
jgi:hypothetical protein